MFSQLLNPAQEVQASVIAPLQAKEQEAMAFGAKYGASPVQVALLVIIGNFLVVRFVVPKLEEGLGRAVSWVPWGKG